MCQFRIQHAPPLDAITHEISNQYFTVDTADLATVDDWIKRNPHYLTYAYNGNVHMGFIGILPLSMEAGALLERNELLEEELTADFILPPESMAYAQYLYISAIAVRDMKNYCSKQAAAALVSCGAGMIRNLYRPDYLKMIFANPTTFWGNRIIGRFGLKPLLNKKRSLRAGNDIYAVEVTPDYWDKMAALEQRYQRFITDYPWPLT